ncbi:hypothetical protein D8Y20_07350 [Mariprofundus sp. EBB-1]|uniref:hypothetical protein n=1 Tax=Mariprofundus sp. EBB-1 TaxID=2650971 RepID=UPI000EF26273|nr:hypothetical protein [Mariprofundus sp. EBB-1]RLL52213.1 hypothetical protein D8Y20_07350 [Mariprofundus sp. EBB-1]
MKKTIITIAALITLMATPALVSASEASVGDKAKAGISSAADWTVSTSKTLWNMTKQGAEDFKAWSEENKKNKKPAKWTRIKTDKGWKIVRTNNKTAI